MTIAFQNVSVPFGRGIDTKNDDKNIAAPFLADLENGVFDKGGSIIKRNGYRALPRQIAGTADRLEKGVAIDSYRGELLLFDNATLYSYSPTSQTWLPRGRAASLKAGSQPIVRNSFGQAGADCALLGSIAVYAWEDTRGGVRATAVDTQTGTLFASDVLLSATGDSPRVVTSADYAFVLFRDGVNIGCVRLSRGLPSQFSTRTNVVVGAASPLVFDACSADKGPLVAWCDSGAPVGQQLRVQFVAPNGLAGVPGNGFYARADLPFSPTQAIALRAATDSEGATRYAVLGASTSQYYLASLTPELVVSRQYAAAALTTALGWSSPYNLTLASDPSDQAAAGADSLTLRVVADTDGASPLLHNVRHAKLVLAASSSAEVSATPLLRGGGLAAKAFFYDRVFYVPCVYDSPLQATYFLLDTDGNLVSKHLPSVAGGLPIRHGALPEVVQSGPAQFAFAGLQKGPLRSEAGSLFSLAGVSQVSFDFAANGRYQSAQLGGALYVLGGLLMLYDGINFVEDGFHVFPEGIALTPQATGGSQSNGSRNYRVCYAWTDNNGQRHRSAPSAPQNVVLSGGTSAQRVTLTIPTLQLTQKVDVVLEVYRTLNNGTVYYKATTAAATPLNNPAAVTQVFEDTFSDVAISANEILYANGGTLENDAPPQLCAIASTKNRLVGIPSEQPLQVVYTKEYTPGDAPGWSLALAKPVPAQGFDAMALGALDDKVLVFKSDRVFFFAGQGPNNAGLDDQFSDIELISADTGCGNPDSIVLTSGGLIFQSDKGIRLIDRSLGIQDVGAAIQGYSGKATSSAVLLEDNDQVRFTIADDRALVYDYYWQAQGPDGRSVTGQWSTFSNHQGTDAINWRGTYTYLRPDGRVFIETPGMYLDDNQQIRLRIVTAWLQFAGPQGYMRVRRATVLGAYRSPHKILTQIAYDYAEFSNRETFDTATGLALTSWGSDKKWGASSPWGGNSDAVYQFRLNPSRQKCQSIRFSFEDLPNPDNLSTGQAYSLNNLSLEVGTKKGLFKLGQGKTAQSG
jgi:hypothetical protein